VNFDLQIIIRAQYQTGGITLDARRAKYRIDAKTRKTHEVIDETYFHSGYRGDNCYNSIGCQLVQKPGLRMIPRI